MGLSRRGFLKGLFVTPIALSTVGQVAASLAAEPLTAWPLRHAVFDLATGTVLQGAGTHSQIVDMGEGWFRVSMTKDNRTLSVVAKSVGADKIALHMDDESRGFRAIGDNPDDMSVEATRMQIMDNRPTTYIAATSEDVYRNGASNTLLYSDEIGRDPSVTLEGTFLYGHK